MGQKTSIFVLKKNNLNFFIIPLLIFVICGISLLIATSWYSVDFKIAEELAKGLNFEIGKYWVSLYDKLGNTELVVVALIYIAILLEILFYKKIKSKNIKFKKNYWIMNSYYFIVLIGWLIFGILNIYMTINEDKGFGKGIDFRLLESIKYKVTATCIVVFYQSIGLCLGFYWVKFHLVKKEKLLENDYQSKITKAFIFLFITYFTIIFIKGGTSKPYYYNVIFGDLLNEHPDLKEIYLNSGYKYGFNSGNGYIDNIPPEFQHPWWLPNGFFRSPPNMPQFSLPWEYAFPSGHVNATYFVGSIILLFINTKNNQKISWKVKACYGLWILHVLTMNFAVIVERFHWASDTAFTFVFSTSCILLVNIGFKKYHLYKINKIPKFAS